MKYKMLIFILNTILVLFACRSVDHFSRLGAPYMSPFYLVFFYVPLCISFVYQDSLLIYYSVISRYGDKRRYLMEKYLFILKECILAGIALVAVPIIPLSIYLGGLSNWAFLFFLPLVFRYILIGFFVCSLTFTLLLLFPFVQKKAQNVVILGIVILPIIAVIREIFTSETLKHLLYYFEVFHFLNLQGNLFDRLILDNAQLIVYSLIIVIMGMFVLVDKMEFLQYEKND